MIYIIGDVHGCYKSLDKLLCKIKLKMSDEVYFVGDVVHKGKDSAKVLELIRSNDWKITMGNHEEKLIKSFKEKKLNKEIITSYKGKEAQLIDDIQYLAQLPYYYAPDEYDEQGRRLIITHGYGYELLERVPLESDVFKRKIVKTRIPEQLTHRSVAKLEASFFNVFGHVPLPRPLIAPCMAGIDTGCYAGNYLCAFRFPDKKVVLQGAVG